VSAGLDSGADLPTMWTNSSLVDDDGGRGVGEQCL